MKVKPTKEALLETIEATAAARATGNRLLQVLANTHTKALVDAIYDKPTLESVISKKTG